MAEKQENNDLRAYNNFRTFSKITFSRGTKEQTDTDNQDKDRQKSTSFDLNSYNWGEDYESYNVSEKEFIPVQKAIITEFQPDFVFHWGEAVDIGVGLVEKGLDSFGLGDTARSAALISAKKAGQVISSSVQKSYLDKPEKVLGKPVDFVKQLFAGRYLNVFEVPFFSDEYLKADTSSLWSQGGAKQNIGEKAASIAKEAFNVDFPTTPTWQLSDAGSRDVFTFEFYLINNNLENLFANFKFLNAFVSGAFWVQLDYIQKSPNVYDIEVPGRFHLYFASLGIEIKHVGKLRTSTQMAANLSSYKSIGPDTLWPDAYQITISVTDLTPNNFNTYLDYLLKGRSDQITVGQRVEAFSVGSDLTGIGKASGAKGAQ